MENFSGSPPALDNTGEEEALLRVYGENLDVLDAVERGLEKAHEKADNAKQDLENKLREQCAVIAALEDKISRAEADIEDARSAPELAREIEKAQAAKIQALKELKKEQRECANKVRHKRQLANALKARAKAPKQPKQKKEPKPRKPKTEGGAKRGRPSKMLRLEEPKKPRLEETKMTMPVAHAIARDIAEGSLDFDWLAKELEEPPREEDGLDFDWLRNEPEEQKIPVVPREEDGLDFDWLAKEGLFG